MATTKLMTAEDLWELGESGNWRRELVRGEVRETGPKGEQHGEVTALITALLWSHVHQSKLGTVYAGGTGFILFRNRILCSGRMWHS